jgi:hypothetical protein
MILFLLTLLASSYSLKGNSIGEPLDTFSDKYVNSFCMKETDTMIICEDDEDVFMQNKAYSRAEFVDRKLVRLDYSFTGDEKAARRISAALTKQYGVPTAETDLQESLSQTWADDQTELSLYYSSATENNLGHPKIRVYISAVKQN